MEAAANPPANLAVLLDVPVRLTVELGGCRMPLREVLQLNPGSVVQLDQEAHSPVQLFVNQKLIARGEVVVVEDHFGLKITEILSGAATPAA